VPALKTEGNRSIGLALKSGNFGAPDFLKRQRAFSKQGHEHNRIEPS